MKKIFLRSALGLSALLLAAGCSNNSSKTENSSSDSVKTSSTDTTMSKDTTLSKDSSQASRMNGVNDFASKAAIAGMTEVEMGKLAQTNGGRPDIKDFGKMLETDHAAANAKLQSIATAENIMLPTAIDEDHAKHVRDMGAMNGADFDKAFISMMIKDHEDAIADFKKAAASNPNDKIKGFASDALPTLQKHLDKAKAIKSKMK